MHFHFDWRILYENYKTTKRQKYRRKKDHGCFKSSLFENRHGVNASADDKDDAFDACCRCNNEGKTAEDKSVGSFTFVVIDQEV